MSKSNTRAVLGFALAVASGALIFTSPASAQSLYVASGENAGGSALERGVQNLTRQAVAGQAVAFSPSANVQSGAYTDPSSNVRASLEREHMVLSHPYAVREQSAAERQSVAARTAAPFYASTDPVFIGKDLSIRSQR